MRSGGLADSCGLGLEGGTSDQFWLTQEQVERLRPHFPKVRGKARSDDRTVLSGIIHVKRNGLRWRDTPSVYGPHKTLYSRLIRWSRLGVFARMLRDLARPGAEGDTLMTDIEPVVRQRSEDRRRGHRRPAFHNKRLYKKRHRIENTFARLKDWRGIATRYTRCGDLFVSAICLAATVLFWLPK